jgi:hypothetical protein
MVDQIQTSGNKLNNSRVMEQFWTRHFLQHQW